MEEKQVFYPKILKPNVFVTYEPFPFDINMFNEESQLVISLLTQFLGLDTIAAPDRCAVVKAQN